MARLQSPARKPVAGDNARMSETAFAEPAVADNTLTVDDLAPTGPMEFSALGLAPKLEKAVADQGYTLIMRQSGDERRVKSQRSPVYPCRVAGWVFLEPQPEGQSSNGREQASFYRPRGVGALPIHLGERGGAHPGTNPLRQRGGGSVFPKFGPQPMNHP